jgi:hypothetical protein
MVSLPFDGLRAVSKAEPSNHKSSNYCFKYRLRMFSKVFLCLIFWKK